MKMTIEPTPEMYDASVNGQRVPVRIWKGTTEGGVPVEAYVLAIVPGEDGAEQLQKELPVFMRPSREAYTIDVNADVFDESQHK